MAKQVEQVIGSFEPVAKFRVVIDREANRDIMSLQLELKSDALDEKGPGR